MEKRSKVQANKSLQHAKAVQEYGPRSKHGQRSENRRESNASRPTSSGTIPKAKVGQHSRQRNIVQRKQVDYVEAQEEPDSELYSVYEHGSKKQNLNHLLNFHYSPRELPSFKKLSKSSSKIYPKYDKNQFLQANCQFVVKSQKDFKLFLKESSDIMSLWDSIEQINIIIQENPQCPICLFPPIACRITKCGHYFCYPCLIHYLTLSDKSWRKCPICNDAITVNDLKSVLIKSVEYHNVSERIHFDLVKREQGSSVVINSSSTFSDREFPSLSDKDVIYSKVVIAETSDIQQIIEREKFELNSELNSNKEELIFIEQALESLNEREQKILQFSENETISPSKQDVPITSTSTYFYQSSDGQNIFLHPINCKMLDVLYGDVNCYPAHITGRILQKEHKIVDATIKKRYKYLEHLPLSSNIEICEIQFLDPVFPDEVLEIFREDIKTREARRKKKEYQENVRFRKINELNDKLMGFKIEEAETKINLESFEQFPDAIVPGTEINQKSPRESSFAKVLSSPTKKQWPIAGTGTNDLNDNTTKHETTLSDKDIDIDIGNAISEAIERGITNNGLMKKKKNKKGMVLFATGLTFEHGK